MLTLTEKTSIQWGEAPIPLLPKCLRNAWSDEKPPNWVRVELGLGVDARLQDFDRNVWGNESKASGRLRHYLTFFVRRRLSGIADFPCLDNPWPIGLNPENVPWSIRTRNALAREGFLEQPERLANTTFRDLLRMEAFGVTSLLDFTTILEHIVSQREEISSLVTIGANKELSEMHMLENLKSALEFPWISEVSGTDPRFSFPFKFDGTLEDHIDNIISDSNSIDNMEDIPELVGELDSIKTKIEEISSKTIEDALIDLLASLSRTKGERLSVLADRFGWNGLPPVTLEACGQKLGVTRERIRQIQNTIQSKIPNHPLFLPQIGRAIEILIDKAPIEVSRAARVLHDYGVARGRFSPISVIAAADMLSISCPIEIVSNKARKYVVIEGRSALVSQVSSAARSTCGKSGFSSVFQIFDSLKDNAQDILEDDVRKLLRSDPHIDFLDEDWFWNTYIPIGRNRFENISRRILSAASPQTLQSIREGVRREYAYRSSSNPRYRDLRIPPQRVLRDFFKRHPKFHVDGDLIHTTEVLDYRKELGKTNAIFIDVIRSSSSGVVDRRSLAEKCLVRGMNINTFNVYTTYSPILEHVGVNIWKIRGTLVAPSAVEAIRSANNLKSRQKRILDYGWCPDGKLWIAVKAPEIYQSLVFAAPSTIAQYLRAHRFKCLSKSDGRECSSVAFDEKGMSWGYHIFAQRYGLDAGDVLLAEFDIAASTVTLSIEPADFLDEDG